MKTIEERAEQYANPDYAIPSYVAYAQRNAYIAGAKDQQYIDKLFIEQLIEKAWSLANSMYQTGKDNLTPLTKDEFIKAMEE